MELTDIYNKLSKMTISELASLKDAIIAELRLRVEREWSMHDEGRASRTDEV